jgi:hypothetical protein
MTTDDPVLSGMVRVGFNLYFYKKCATEVGYKEHQTSLDLYGSTDPELLGREQELGGHGTEGMESINE